MKLTDFEGWVKGFDLDKPVGQTRNYESCPIAQFGHYLGMTNAKCGCHSIWWGRINPFGNVRKAGRSLPEWARAFVRAVDSLPGKKVTAAQALAIVAEKR